MKLLILICSLILCVSCASSRQELSTQQSSAVTELQMISGSDCIEELLTKLAAKYSDSVHVVVKNYYPPKSDSDSVGPLKTEVIYQRKAKADVDKIEKKEVHAKDSTAIQRNDSINNERIVEIQEESSAFKINKLLLIDCFVALIFLYVLKVRN